MSNERGSGMAREYYGGKPRDIHVTGCYVIKNRKFYSFWDITYFSVPITYAGS
jgi:hypothetical protein